MVLGIRLCRFGLRWIIEMINSAYENEAIDCTRHASAFIPFILKSQNLYYYIPSPQSSPKNKPPSKYKSPSPDGSLSSLLVIEPSLKISALSSNILPAVVAGDTLSARDKTPSWDQGIPVASKFPKSFLYAMSASANLIVDFKLHSSECHGAWSEWITCNLSAVPTEDAKKSPWSDILRDWRVGAKVEGLGIVSSAGNSSGDVGTATGSDLSVSSPSPLDAAPVARCWYRPRSLIALDQNGQPDMPPVVKPTLSQPNVTLVATLRSRRMFCVCSKWFQQSMNSSVHSTRVSFTLDYR